MAKYIADTAQSQYRIGSVLDQMANPQAALEEHFKCLAIRESLVGEGHLDTADTYYGIAAATLHNQTRNNNRKSNNYKAKNALKHDRNGLAIR